MRRSPRRFALGLLAVMVLLANGYAGLVAHTLLLGPRVDAEVTSCSHSVKDSTTCTGRWVTSDGQGESGHITGAGRSDLGQRVTIRTGPLGAFTDNIHAHLWVRTIFAVGVDGGLVLAGVLLWRIRRHGPAAVARLQAECPASAELFVVGGNAIGLLDGTRLFVVKDVDRRGLSLRDTSGVERWSLRGEDLPGGMRALTLVDQAGGLAGSVSKRVSTVSLLDSAGEWLADVVHQRVYGVPGMRFVSPTGQELAVGVSTRGAIVVRIGPAAPQILVPLIFGYVQGAGWLSRPQFRRKTSPSVASS